MILSHCRGVAVSEPCADGSLLPTRWLTLTREHKALDFLHGSHSDGCLGSFIPNKSLLRGGLFFFLLALSPHPGISFLVHIQSWKQQELKT